MNCKEINIEDMQANAQSAAKWLSGLSNPHRLLILCHLIDSEKSVSNLISRTGIAQTSMSQHLGKLKEEGIITFRRDHRTLYYFIQDPVTIDIMKLLYDHFCAEEKEQTS